jgi:xanthine dehydrogenase accessory factor
MSLKLNELTILIKGGGEVGSAVAHRLTRSGLRVCLTETRFPLAVHRGTTYCETIYDGEKEVEGIIAKLVFSPEQVYEAWAQNKIPIIVDPEAQIKSFIHPHVLIDAIMAKRNSGTKITDAPLVIGLGPVFLVNCDVHVVIETNHSEDLGKVITRGEAERDTRVPVSIGGFTFERVLNAPVDGQFVSLKNIGDNVSQGETVALVAGEPVEAKISGIVRGLLRSNTEIKGGAKVGEIDPVNPPEICYKIRAKMRAIAGGVLEAILMFHNVHDELKSKDVKHI